MRNRYVERVTVPVIFMIQKAELHNHTKTFFK